MRLTRLKVNPSWRMSKKVYNLRSLPGGRRGTSGASAGCHSMGTIGGQELSRRAPTDKSTTADRRGLNRRARGVEVTADDSGDETSLFSSIPSTRPSYMTRRTPTLSTSSSPDSVVQDVIPDCELAPTSGLPITRRRWTPEMNQFILRTYLQLTALDTDTKTYLEPLHLKFTEKFPDMQASRQRVGDQRRAIVRNKLLPQDTIDRIYNEVEFELRQLHSNIHEQQKITSQHPTPTQLSISQTQNPTNSNQSRMRWTNEQNEAIIRTYYRITNLGTNETAYRKLLHNEFINQFPSLAHLSEQRIADQRRAIVNNKYITNNRLNIIKQDVAKELGINNINKNECNQDLGSATNKNDLNSNNPNLNELPNHMPINLHLVDDDQFNIHSPKLVETDTVNSDTNTITQRNQTIDTIFLQALEFYRNTDPTERTYIPKQKPSKSFAEIVDYLNKVILPENTNTNTDFPTLQTIIYSAAWTAAKVNGSKITLQPGESQRRPRNEYKPSWQRRMEKRQEKLRIEIGRLTQFINGNRSRFIVRQVKHITDTYKIHTIHEEPNTQATHTLDTVKQKLAVISGRLKRYKACDLRKKQNTQFAHNEKLFYRTIKQHSSNLQESNTNDQQTTTPDKDVLTNFWASIWQNPVQHNTQAEWIRAEKNHNSTHLQTMAFEHIPVDTFHKVLKHLHNWKAPGSDYIHSYWYKKFSSIHGYLHNHINNFILNPNSLPTYLTSGKTFMIPKDTNDLTNPAKYRPITCLQTLYKIVTACLSDLIYQHIDANNILAEQQKGCRKFSQGCKEQLIIDSVILRQVQRTKSDLFTMYIDYKKAYDSVPHSWLIEVLNIYKIHPTIVNFLKSAMINWTTILKLSSPTEVIETDPIQIQRGIFQGDALSPLWFCLALNPLSSILNSTAMGYPLKSAGNDQHTDIERSVLNHLLYMDDIKLYARSENQLEELASLTEEFTNDVKMEFGIDKCKVNSIMAGHNYQHQYTLDSGDIIDSLDEGDSYKYLGYIQSKLIHYKDTKQKLTQQFQHRLNTILKTQLYSRNTIKAINTFAIPILTYSFGVINWTKTDLRNLQRKINTTMTKFRKNHPRSCLQRLTLARKEGGRGIIDITNLHNRQITTLRQYFFNKSESSTIHKLIALNDQQLTPLNLKDTTVQKNENLVDDKTKLAEWTQKSLHGRHRQDLCQPNVDKEASNAWLNRGELFPETEGFMIAIQDQIIRYNNHRLAMPWEMAQQ
ncbi:uncharacterized protein LOC142973811 [Anticarsia gemmatalis]|uniref:uncharacterized protein LOC142973811 n=1 Tax=Anticarsia gemmatalis TaxID=129554 RepID=UPI003F76E5AB